MESELTGVLGSSGFSNMTAMQIDVDQTSLHTGIRCLQFAVTMKDLVLAPTSVMHRLNKASAGGRMSETLEALADLARWIEHEKEKLMSWHTILENAAGETVADVGHHPFTSAGLFFKALDGDFRIKIDGQNAGNLADTLSAAIDAMDSYPQEFKEFEGPNGSLDGARAYLVSLRIACLANPAATVRVIGDQVATTTAPQQEQAHAEVQQSEPAGDD